MKLCNKEKNKLKQNVLNEFKKSSKNYKKKIKKKRKTTAGL
ncbi:hypothetical protein DOY81_005461 [Sarcophaga bullata]|nr:hypothetical protein DOY81_005461 [Sarcophaga bullata]